jgi:hypothetical protein
VVIEAGPEATVRVRCLVCRWRRWCKSLKLLDNAIEAHVARCTGLPPEIWDLPRAELGSGF